MKKLLSIILTVILMFALVSCGTDKTAKLIKENVNEIKSLEPGGDFSDLEFLKEEVKDKKLVGLGEATHGTREFFTIKHRLVQYLVEEMGYRVFIMEIDAGAAQQVNDYILNGEGNVDDAVANLKTVVFQTEEIRDMFKWMREYNENPAHESKIKFYGMDCQSGPLAYDYAVKYMEKIDKDMALEIRYNLRYAASYFYDEARFNELSENMDKSMELIESKADYCSSNNLSEEYDMVLYNLNLIKNFMEFSTAINNDTENPSESADIRDRLMAENINYIYESEKKKGNDRVILWAHNFHIGTSETRINTMGWYLRGVFSEDYYALGLEFLDGRFSSVDAKKIQSPAGAGFTMDNFQEFKAPKCGPESVSRVLNNKDMPNYFIKISNTGNQELDEKLSENMLFHNVGFPYIPDGDYNFLEEIPNTFFDGLIFIRNTTASKVIK